MSETIELMHALADGQLEGEAKADAQRLLETDEAARREYEWAVATKTLLATKCQPVTDDECWSRSLEQLDAIDRTSRTESFVGRYAWAMCAFFLIAILSASFVNRNAGSRALSTADVATLFSIGNGGSEAVEEPSRARELLESTLGDAPVNVSEPAVEVVSFTPGSIGDKRAAKMILQDRYGATALFVVEDTWRFDGLESSNRDGNYELGMLNGHNCVTWSEGGYGLLLMGERPHSNLQQIADSIRIEP